MIFWFLCNITSSDIKADHMIEEPYLLVRNLFGTFGQLLKFIRAASIRLLLLSFILIGKQLEHNSDTSRRSFT